MMNRLIEQNITCLVELGRPVIADKAWGSKVKNEESPVPCVSCPQGCLSKPAEGGMPRLCCLPGSIPLVPYER